MMSSKLQGSATSLRPSVSQECKTWKNRNGENSNAEPIHSNQLQRNDRIKQSHQLQIYQQEQKPGRPKVSNMISSQITSENLTKRLNQLIALSEQTEQRVSQCDQERNGLFSLQRPSLEDVKCRTSRNPQVSSTQKADIRLNPSSANKSSRPTQPPPPPPRSSSQNFNYLKAENHNQCHIKQVEGGYPKQSLNDKKKVRFEPSPTETSAAKSLQLLYQSKKGSKAPKPPNRPTCIQSFSNKVSVADLWLNDLGIESPTCSTDNLLDSIEGRISVPLLIPAESYAKLTRCDDKSRSKSVSPAPLNRKLQIAGPPINIDKSSKPSKQISTIKTKAETRGNTQILSSDGVNPQKNGINPSCSVGRTKNIQTLEQKKSSMNREKSPANILRKQLPPKNPEVTSNNNQQSITKIPVNKFKSNNRLDNECNYSISLPCLTQIDFDEELYEEGLERKPLSSSTPIPYNLKTIKNKTELQGTSTPIQNKRLSTESTLHSVSMTNLCTNMQCNNLTNTTKIQNAEKQQQIQQLIKELEIPKLKNVIHNKTLKKGAEINQSPNMMNQSEDQVRNNIGRSSDSVGKSAGAVSLGLPTNVENAAKSMNIADIKENNQKPEHESQREMNFPLVLVQKKANNTCLDPKSQQQKKAGIELQQCQGSNGSLAEQHQKPKDTYPDCNHLQRSHVALRLAQHETKNVDLYSAFQRKKDRPNEKINDADLGFVRRSKNNDDLEPVQLEYIILQEAKGLQVCNNEQSLAEVFLPLHIYKNGDWKFTGDKGNHLSYQERIGKTRFLPILLCPTFKTFNWMTLGELCNTIMTERQAIPKMAGMFLILDVRRESHVIPFRALIDRVMDYKGHIFFNYRFIAKSSNSGLSSVKGIVSENIKSIVRADVEAAVQKFARESLERPRLCNQTETQKCDLEQKRAARRDHSYLTSTLSTTPKPHEERRSKSMDRISSATQLSSKLSKHMPRGTMEEII